MLMKVRTITYMVCLALLAAIVTVQAQEAQQQGRGRGRGNRPRLADDPAAWTYLAQGNVAGSLALDEATPLDSNHPRSLKLTVTEVGRPEKGDRCGIVNNGAGGMNIQEGRWYDFTFSAYADENRSVGLVFSLEAPDGTICARATIPEIGRGRRGGRRGQPAQEPTSPWRQYKLALQAYNSNPQCKLVIKPIEPVTMHLSGIEMSRRRMGGRRGGARATN